MRPIIVILFALGFVSLSSASDDIVIERVIGREFPGPYKHPATIAELQNGDLYIAYYGGEGEYEGDTKVYGMRLVKGKKEWTKPVVIAEHSSASRLAS